MKDEEFYIGYLPKAPGGIARFTRRTVIGLILLGAVVSVLVVVGQKAFYPSTFEFLQYRTFEGVLYESPYPVLRVMRPGSTGELPTYSNYYLVNEGKFGAQEAAAGLNGQSVTLEGALIYRDDQVMIEIKPGTLTGASSAPSGSVEQTTLGEFTLRGEIVDSKCYLGVMNPGDHKTHKSCAVRCISGGVPPLFVVKGTRDEITYLMLVGENGEMIHKEVLDVVAEPLEITGTVVREGDLLIIKANPASFRRLTR